MAEQKTHIRTIGDMKRIVGETYISVDRKLVDKFLKDINEVYDDDEIDFRGEIAEGDWESVYPIQDDIEKKIKNKMDVLSKKYGIVNWELNEDKMYNNYYLLPQFWNRVVKKTGPKSADKYIKELLSNIDIMKCIKI